MFKAIVSLSGGMDSATVLAEALAQYAAKEPENTGPRGAYGVVSAVSFTYGSKHNVYENKMARMLCNYYSVPFQLIDIFSITKHFKSNLLADGGDIPEGHYEHESMKLTVVPGRNMIFISTLLGLAWSRGASEVWLGIHAGDHAIYPDCRPQFFESMKSAAWLGSDERITLKAPFLNVDKGEILKRGLQLNVPYHLTRTCYKAQDIACGKCGACQERLLAFARNNRTDPLQYEE